MIMNDEIRMLLVDDEPEFLSSAKIILRASGIAHVDTLTDSRKLLSSIHERRPSLIILDLTMPYVDGKQCLVNLQEQYPEIPVIVLTGLIDLEGAVWCMRNGAIDYLTKPIHHDEFVHSVQRVIQQIILAHETAQLRKTVLSSNHEIHSAFAPIITQSSIMKNIFSYSQAISRTKFPVLVTGETGTGKESIVRALHDIRHPDAPFVSVNVAGLDDQMFSDTLFGHIKGAYTGALQSREGVIEKARGGTLFLDEIGDLKRDSQIKLLRLIQENEYYPIGSDTAKNADVWIIAATNLQISELPDFRKDLYYRLKTHQIDLPPLRDRREDIPLLIRYFAEQAAKRIGLPETWNVPKRLIDLLVKSDFPGNIRELQGIVFDIVACSDETGVVPESVLTRFFTAEQLMDDFQYKSTTSGSLSDWSTLPTLKEMETLLVREALQRCNKNKSCAGELLGVTRQTIAKLCNDQC